MFKEHICQHNTKVMEGLSSNMSPRNFTLEFLPTCGILTVDSRMAQHGWHPQYRSRDGGDEPPEQGWQVFTGPPKSIHGDSKYKLS